MITVRLRRMAATTCTHWAYPGAEAPAKGTSGSPNITPGGQPPAWGTTELWGRWSPRRLVTPKSAGSRPVSSANHGLTCSKGATALCKHRAVGSIPTGSTILRESRLRSRLDGGETSIHGEVAKLVRHLVLIQKIAGSSPVFPTTHADVGKRQSRLVEGQEFCGFDSRHPHHHAASGTKVASCWP